MKNILSSKKSNEDQWLPISDLMSVLMMIFLLIAISYMIKVTQEKDKIEEIAITYNKLQNELYEDLQSEFEYDLKKWDATLDKSDLSIRFKSPDILFATGSENLKKEFKAILDDFWPRYIEIISDDKYNEDISEIRIEGHTSSMWRVNTSDRIAYVNNMELSQGRTRNVLAYLLNIPDVSASEGFIKAKVTANGLSSSKLIVDDNDVENAALSQRVEFRVKTNAEKRIAQILTN
ncbi:MAG: outer membrane protein OmpA-like peptidoglycan-associated protein [Cyclobacteriaceae bacterium]|jgi:outer membrane protein OmpA-like peptidoglycan-associated protein